ncbi:transmembrane alpha-helix domain-containing protein [Colletotrichum paranaense]|uniref:Transmembrane alpha-helix domain-containing protein n=3 Tax=Colletotrichum acutatum species complex TaxID=2707335 RepID=A0A9P9XE94_9PEZI|nr:transmembrane alpha-helix domain-containing protein [Colletotrichum costaricense]XP_060350364.1 transmembrane alpha-helix domain-containing protein [Colletotrichum paranaense]XP_060392197.1 transmembrane alpha-helix domain-containing protein [Colletotrichum abscissum]KAI3541507.1 transmembrane alpha-helix domain-containing protein [Colletotrichum filicis]KAI3551454.1 transmembrane alpha-helix domain-containing protein [Colletotrichum abscissum]KAK1477335.1 transmembrane alpha-helix domain-c
MKYSVAVLAAVAFGFSSAQTATTTSGYQKPSEAARPGAITNHGCYNASSTTWQKYPVENISTGSCTLECQTKQKKNVAAINGEDCYCGDSYPPKVDVVDDKKCNFPCPFYPEEACGGVEDMMYYSVFNTGLKLVVPDEDVATTTTAAATTKATTTTAANGVVSTVIETPVATTSAAATETPKKSTNVAGIAAGVVVGVVAIAAIVGAAFFFVRRKRNAEIEEEHRRNAAVNAFIGGSKPPSSSGVSMSDSRMDPTLAHRRMSDGSIADNQDYSRKILRVTNA